MSAETSNRTALSIASRRGITLLELLIVIMIFLMVTAVAIPIMRPALGGRRIRESGRQLAAYLQGAKVKAASIGRPVGIRIDRINNRGYGMNIFQVEVPPPWAGDSAPSRIRIVNTYDPMTESTNVLGKVYGFPFNDATWQGLLKPGDLVELDYRSPLYELGGPIDPMTKVLIGPPSGWRVRTLTGALFSRPDCEVTTGAYPGSPDKHDGWPFRIIRQPVNSATATLVFTDGAVIDFENSGLGSTVATTPGDINPITVVFNPAGYVEAVYAQGVMLRHPRETVFLLVGKPEKVGAENLADLENIWVAITPDGTITTEQNASGATLAERRRFARESQNIGGR